DVALVCERMFCLAQILRRRERLFKMTHRCRIVLLCQRGATEGELGADVLAKGRALTAFPRLEVSLGEQLHRFGWPPGLVEQPAKLHAQVIALPDESGMLFQLPQA